MPQEVRGVMVRQTSGQGDERAKEKVLLSSVGWKVPGAEWEGGLRAASGSLDQGL